MAERKMNEHGIIRAGDAYENAYLRGTYMYRNFGGDQEFIVTDVTFKCNVGEFKKGEQLKEVLLFSYISDDGSCLELIITEPDRGDRTPRLCVAQRSVL